jgi:DNA polymerase-3 subunit epsilon
MTLLTCYDTETTGLPLWEIPSDDPKQPHVTQVAAILFDDATEVERMDAYVKPDGWTVSEEITKLTGITMEHLMDVGRPIKDVIEQFMAMLGKSEGRVAHNDVFDARMLRIELSRLYGKDDPCVDVWKNFPSFCTMNESKSICRIPAKTVGKYKNPKLVEAYEFFFCEPPKVQHNAMDDAESALAIYHKIREHQKSHAHEVAL